MTMEEKESILVVEDEEKIRSALADFLEFHNFEVTQAVDGLEAERSVAGRRFDLILLDLMLPKISGEQLCSKWRGDGLQTPIIMLTAKGQEKEKVAGLNLGADDYVTKPFSLEELLARINAVLRRTDPARRYCRPENKTLRRGNRNQQEGGGDNTVLRRESEPSH